MKPKKNRVRCLALKNGRSKMLFESEAKANRFIKFNEDEIRKTGATGLKGNLRPYYCKVCGGWHITHADLTEEEIQERESRIDDIIERAHRDLEIKKKIAEDQEQDTWKFIKTFDLKSFGGKKKFKKYIGEHKELIPPGLRIDQIYHIINEMPQECFDTLTPDSKLSQEEIEKEANDLYSELPLSKLKDQKMVLEYIKWEFKYKRGVAYEIINKLHELCGLR